MSDKNQQRINADKVRQSGAFGRAMKLAGKIAGKASSALGYIGKASTRLRLLEGAGKNWETIKDDFLDLLRMLKAYYNGDYKVLPVATVTKALAGVVYLVFIVDFIPDFIPIVGFLDDIAVIGWILNSIKGDIDAFRSWKTAEKITDVEETVEIEDINHTA